MNFFLIYIIFVLYVIKSKFLSINNNILKLDYEDIFKFNKRFFYPKNSRKEIYKASALLLISYLYY